MKKLLLSLATVFTFAATTITAADPQQQIRDLENRLRVELAMYTINSQLISYQLSRDPAERALSQADLDQRAARNEQLAQRIQNLEMQLQQLRQQQAQEEAAIMPMEEEEEEE
jgi:uncharacterized phage infection (PIP) family protein YhgE